MLGLGKRRSGPIRHPPMDSGARHRAEQTGGTSIISRLKKGGARLASARCSCHNPFTIMDSGVSAMTAVLADRGSHPVDFQNVADTIRSTLGTDIALVGLTFPDRGARILSVSGARHPERFLGLEIPPGRGITGKALSELRPVSTNNYLRDYTFVHSDQYDRINAAESVVTKAVCPVLGPPFNKVVFGVIIVANRSSQLIDVPALVSAAHSLSSSSIHHLPLNLLLDHLSYIFVNSTSRSWTFSQIQALCSRVGVDIMEVNRVTIDGVEPHFVAECSDRIVCGCIDINEGTFLSVGSRWFVVRCHSLDLADRMVVERFVCGMLAMLVARQNLRDLLLEKELISGKLAIIRSWENGAPSTPTDLFTNVMLNFLEKNNISAQIYRLSVGIGALCFSDDKEIKSMICEVVSMYNERFGGVVDGIYFGSFHGTEKQLISVASLLAEGIPRGAGVQNVYQCPSGMAELLIKHDAGVLFKRRYRSMLKSVSTHRLKIWAESLQNLLQYSSLRKAAKNMGIPESSLRARVHVIEKMLSMHVASCGRLDIKIALDAIREEIGRREQKPIK